MKKMLKDIEDGLQIKPVYTFFGQVDAQTVLT